MQAMQNNNNQLITPRTRIGELLENFPELEEVLYKMSPAFNKLKNPVLRRTVAKIATLQQAAALGSIPLSELINTLREKVGQELFHGDNPEGVINTNMPEWYNPDHIAGSFDASTLIEAGENPMKEVFYKLDQVGVNEIFLLYTPFVPAPIIELIMKKGYDHYCIMTEKGVCNTYFIKNTVSE